MVKGIAGDQGMLTPGLNVNADMARRVTVGGFETYLGAHLMTDVDQIDQAGSK